jgi:hypothetical protein
MILAIVAGGTGGFFYWHHIGCQTGSCPITSEWYNSSLYGALMGGLLVNMFKDFNVKKT